MKALTLLALAALLAAELAGCGGSSPAAGAASPPPTVTGLSTPKSVSVVTAN
jgi:hypothetical protein